MNIKNMSLLQAFSKFFTTVNSPPRHSERKTTRKQKPILLIHPPSLPKIKSTPQRRNGRNIYRNETRCHAGIVYRQMGQGERASSFDGRKSSGITPALMSIERPFHYVEGNGNEGHPGSSIDLVWKSLKYLFPEFLRISG